jgi:hypothetical protein
MMKRAGAGQRKGGRGDEIESKTRCFTMGACRKVAGLNRLQKNYKNMFFKRTYKAGTGSKSATKVKAMLCRAF